MCAAKSAAVFHRHPEFRRGVHEPSPERGGIAAEHRKLVGRRVVELPQVDADMGGGRHGDLSGGENARIEVDRHALGECVPRLWSANSDDRETIGLVDDRSNAGELVAKSRRETKTVLAIRGGEPAPRAGPDEGDWPGRDATRLRRQIERVEIADAPDEWLLRSLPGHGGDDRKIGTPPYPYAGRAGRRAMAPGIRETLETGSRRKVNAGRRVGEQPQLRGNGANNVFRVGHGRRSPA